MSKRPLTPEVLAHTYNECVVLAHCRIATAASRVLHLFTCPFVLLDSHHRSFLCSLLVLSRSVTSAFMSGSVQSSLVLIVVLFALSALGPACMCFSDVVGFILVCTVHRLQIKAHVYAINVLLVGLIGQIRRDPWWGQRSCEDQNGRLVRQ